MPNQPAPFSFGKITILVVDDDEDCLFLFSHVFEESRYNLILSSSLDTLWETVKEVRIDVLLTDVMLKNGDCRSICKRLKAEKDTGYFPVIFMSASKEKLKDFQQWGADEVIEKPFAIEDLYQKIENVLKR